MPMKKIAIVGSGPTGIYTFFSLLKSKAPLSVSIYERNDKAGMGMPYNDKQNSRIMLANIASIEIPQIVTTYLEWLQNQDHQHLAQYGVDKCTLHDHQFLPRILLGQYFRHQFMMLVKQASKRGFNVAVHESCEVTDLQATGNGVKLWVKKKPVAEVFDMAVIATGHVWPKRQATKRTYFPSPWSDLLRAEIPARKVGIMGTSLSAIDAAMLVAIQHGHFVKINDQHLRYDLQANSRGLSITLMSRSGILPEADFYCPIPYEPLEIATKTAIKAEIAAGPDHLLDRVFALAAQEIKKADPAWSKRVSLDRLDADRFTDAYFASRTGADPFRWACLNLKEVEKNNFCKHTVPWRYAILRLHEVVGEIVPFLDETDKKRFENGLRKVFIDNYSAIPVESIRRLIALRKAAVIQILKLGHDYSLQIKPDHTVITTAGNKHMFEIFIDARGQKPLKIKDLPFPNLRRQLQHSSDNISDISRDYILSEPDIVKNRIAFAAIPYLMHDYPFVQGITVSADIGATIAKNLVQEA